MQDVRGAALTSAANFGGARDNALSTAVQVVAWICLGWYIFIWLVCSIGYTQLRRYYSSPPTLGPSAAAKYHEDAPHITVIRPVKGLEPQLYECLASTFQQTHPREKLTIRLCVSSQDDPAVPVLRQIVKDYSDFDVKILVEDEDPALQVNGGVLGPNPKIRNMSRAYREAKGDLIWIIDCNVWIDTGVMVRMVDTLCGYRGKRKYKFVHQLPLVVDTIGTLSSPAIKKQLGLSANGDVRVSSSGTNAFEVDNKNSGQAGHQSNSHMLSWGGGRLEEMFMSTSHAKFYTAINTVLVAPCIVGKSTMFRKSHVDYLTGLRSQNGVKGLDYFSDNICEDHLIGDLLWKNSVPEEQRGEKWGKHSMVWGDLAIQPMANMSVREYIARRIRWLRVRKFTVLIATLVEPGTESFLVSLYGAFAITTLPYFSTLGIPPTWTSFWLFWFCSVCVWALVDWTQYRLIQSRASLSLGPHTPAFVKPWAGGRTLRPFGEWLAAWLGREILAFPIWAWAFYGGVTVTWRGERFWVGTDMKVHRHEEKDKKNR